MRHWIEDEVYLVNRQDYRRKILDAWRRRCIYCGDNATTLDHLVPRSSPESTELSNNLAPACLRCNQSKGQENMELWYRSQSIFNGDRLFWILEWQRSPWV